jgi:O-acetyl-ADP-ribose deacetylase (regulator of RNase III)
MLTELEGDLFSTPYLYIAHGCNAQGVMGAGVSLEVKKRFPKAYADYQTACRLSSSYGQLLGRVISSDVGDYIILNCITQLGVGFRKQVDYDAIDDCFLGMRESLPRNACVAIPRIGAGLGGGNWKIIRTIIEEACAGYYNVYVYTPKELRK